MKLLIADDDLQIRTGLKEGIDWKSLKVDEVLTAENGIEAIKLFEDNRPGIVITDIRMPGLDGLELSRKIRELSETTKIIVISGYSDFEYAKKSLQFGVSDYLLKPVKIAELKKLVIGARDEIIEQLKIEEEEKEHRFLYKERIIEDILLGNISDGQVIADLFRKHFSMADHKSVACILLEIDHYVVATKNWTPDQKKTLSSEIISLIHTLLSNRNIIIQQKAEKLFAIFADCNHSSSERQRGKLTEFHKNLNGFLEEHYGISASIGVSSPGAIAELSDRYRQSLRLLSHKLYLGTGSIMFSNDVTADLGHKYIESINEKELREAISRCDYTAVSTQINEKLESLKRLRCTDSNLIKDSCIDLKNILIRTIKEEGINFEELFGNNLHMFSDTGNMETIDEYKEWIQNVYYIVITGLSDLNGVRHNPLMRKAVEYIKKNYYRDLTVNMLSEYVQKNPNYFSHLFKKEFGVSFVEYLNKLRIEEAKRLMKHTGLMAYEIAEKVGFQDYKYFTQVFKKQEGHPPSKLRKDSTL